MKKLRSEYWDTFITIDNKGKPKGDGEKFEKLIDSLLLAKYGKRWNATKKSHDDNRDFWMYSDEQHIWTECKNYQKSIAMNILAPTLVMAQIYEVNEILFFSRSNINSSAKDKILAFGEKSGKNILFYDGENLESLIWRFRNQIPSQYSPMGYLEEDEKELSTVSPVNLYFYRSAVSNVQTVFESFENYINADTIHYNETFALTFCLLNPFYNENANIEIEFLDESEDRFYFQYFISEIISKRCQWYHVCLKEGEGKAISLNMRQIKYKPEIYLPQFRIRFTSEVRGKFFEWISDPVLVKCSWVGKTKLIGENYWKVLHKTEEQLLCNPQISCLIITGSSGTGKSRLLTECQNIFLRNSYRIINLSGQKDYSSRSFLKEIISFLYEIPSDTMLKLLEERLFESSATEADLSHTEAERAIQLLKKVMNSSTEETLKETLNSYADILYEKLSKDKHVLIIDNVQYVGSTFQYFIEQYIYYSLNRQNANHSVLLLTYNLDYMTPLSSEMLYNILHSGIQNLYSCQLKGFAKIGQGIAFLQELTRTKEDANKEFFLEIIKKVSLKPYHLFQTVKYMEENNIIRITPERQGYIVPGLDKFRMLSDTVSGIDDILARRFRFIGSHISSDRLLLICSIMYVFDILNKELRQIFCLHTKELEYLCDKNILSIIYDGTYSYDHDVIRNFFITHNKDSVLNCLLWLQDNNAAEKIRHYQTAYLLYKITILEDEETVLDTCKRLLDIAIPERIASLFYNHLLEAMKKILINGQFEGIYLKYIHQICAFIRQYDGSEKTWSVTKELYELIQQYYPDTLSKEVAFFRPLIHFCCDTAMQLHFYDEGILFIKKVLNDCKNACPTELENQDELYVLQAIMYNRWYISYNTQSFKEEIQDKRKFLMDMSRKYIDKIVDLKKKGLVKYLNDSDEGYNFYGYQSDKKKLLKIWNRCIVDIPTLVPEKTLNYYRKKVQYGLINQDRETVRAETQKAIQYIMNGKYSHEPIIFRTFFLMAEVMSNLQHEAKTTCYYNARIIENILQIQQLLNNHKTGDILLLKGVNAYYAGNTDDVYYAFVGAHEYFIAEETSRYWVKEELLKENICYAFTALGIYEKGYDLSCLPPECRQPMTPFPQNDFKASGIQRSGDLHFNLPLI